MLKEADYYDLNENGAITCKLCPYNCSILPGKYGRCQVRVNNSNKLYADTYGKITALHNDPIEKKPLYHFFPGSNILSVGSFGCNFNCPNCQNWEIAQSCNKNDNYVKEVTPNEIFAHLKRCDKSTVGVAYTYNEPIIFIEFMLHTARLVKQAGYKNVMVSNGFINVEPLTDLFSCIDAFNIDLKGFSDDVYKKYLHADLTPVCNTLKQIRMAGKHLEITFLLIPNVSDNFDDFKRMIHWIADELGEETIFHISRYFPKFKLKEPSTDVTQMDKFYHFAKSHLKYVYFGNVAGFEGSNTYCPKCNHLCIERYGYSVSVKGLNKSGCCSNCGDPVAIKS